MSELAKRGAAHPAKKIAKKASAKKAAAKKAAAKKAPAKKAAKKAAKKVAKKAAKKSPAKKATKTSATAAKPAMAARPALSAPPTDPLVILGLKAPFTATQLRHAWRRYAARHHPDRGGDASTFVRGRAAFEALLERTP